MDSVWDKIKALFTYSNRVDNTGLFNLRNRIVGWTETGRYPASAELPPAISLDSDFWNRVTEIYRNTTADRHERAISVFWADGEFVLTESIRGETGKIDIPRQVIEVAYKPTSDNQYAEKFVTVNGKVYTRRKILWKSLPAGRKIEVLSLFNMHTHPPHDVSTSGTDTPWYSFFSLTDLNSFLGSRSVMTGMVTNKLWMLFKTANVKTDTSGVIEAELTPKVLLEQFGIKVYSGLFGSLLVSEQDNEIKE